MSFVVAIPAYNPDERLITLVKRLRELSDPVLLLVDDGSREDCQPLFASCERDYGCDVVHHPRNMGKGAALKTIAARVADAYAGMRGYITADCDLQHSPEDILRVAEALEKNPDSLILGVRDFKSRGVPARSRFGNTVTSMVFYLKTHQKCSDTQTGLRGIPASFAALAASLPGERFEYEMNVLLEAASTGLGILEAPIDTVYIDENATSSFRVLEDSARIYWNIFKYGCSSAISAAIELSVFLLLVWLIKPGPAGVFASAWAARAVSGLANFAINQHWVFASRGQTGRKGASYLALFVAIATASAGLTSLLSRTAIPIAFSKIAVDIGLSVVSYSVQKHWIFHE